MDLQIPSWPQADGREAELLQEVLRSGQWGGFHPFVEEFEKKFAAFQHCQYGIAACNGTLTLELALTVLNVGPGDEVIVPAISFISTATAVSRVGAAPVFVDIQRDSFNIDPQRVREAISSRTKAIVPVHFGGVMCDMDALGAICREYGFAMLEDAAHAHGSSWDGKRAGSFGVAGSFSFQNGKVMSSGEGGVLVASEEAFAQQARSIVNQGRKPGCSFYEHYELGTNFRMTGFQAAVLLAQFERLPRQNRDRALHAGKIKQALADLPSLVWQHNGHAASESSGYLMVGRLDNAPVARDLFCQRLAAAGVPCTPFYPHPLYANPLYRKGGCRVMPCPESERRIDDGFWLSHRVLLADEDTAARVAVEIRNALSLN